MFYEEKINIIVYITASTRHRRDIGTHHIDNDDLS